MCFEDIVVEHSDWIARLAFRFYSRKADAADLAQETLIRILTNSDKYDPRLAFKPWAMTVMTNIFKTREARIASVPFLAFDEMDVQTDNGVMQSIEYRELLRMLDRYASTNVSIMCVLLYAQGYTYDEIAKSQQLSVGTVKSRIFNGRKLLADRLRNYVN